MIHYEQVFFNNLRCFHLKTSRKTADVRGGMRVKFLCFFVVLLLFNWKDSFNSSFMDPKEDAYFIKKSHSSFVQEDRLPSSNKAVFRSVGNVGPLIPDINVNSSLMIYYHLLRIFFVVNRMLTEESVRINHCTVIGEDKRKTYKNITNCFLKSFHPFKNRRKFIMVQVQVGDELAVDFNLLWSSLKAMDLVKWVFRSKNTTNSFDITAASPYTVSDVFEHLINIPRMDTVADSLQSLSELRMDRIKLDVKNHRGSYRVVHFELLRESTPLYGMKVLTDYRYGKRDFSIEPF